MIQTGLLSTEQPSKIQPLNNGQMTVLYNYDIEEVHTITSESGTIEVVPGGSEGQETTTMYRYSCVRVEYPISADNIFATGDDIGDDLLDGLAVDRKSVV